MQNLFICKFSALKIQFFPSVSVLPSSRTPLSFHPPRHPASFLVGTRLLDLGGTRALAHAAWYGEARGRRTECAVQAVRFGECGLSRTIIIFGDCAGGRLFSNLYPEKVLPRRLRAQDTLGRESARRAQDLFEVCAHQTVAEPLLGRERRLRAQDTLRRALTARPSGGQRGKYY